MAWWGYLLIGIGILVAILLLWSYVQMRKLKHAKTSDRIIHLNDKTFSSFIKRHSIVVVDFWADWCMPCKVLQPTLNQLAEKYVDKIKVAKLDVDYNRRIAAQYQVQNIPTVIFFVRGKEVHREIGVKTLKQFEKILEKYFSQ
jgi:thioredoxin 1